MGPHQSLGLVNRRLGNIANPATQTCNDCELGGTTHWIHLFNTIALLTNPYICENNIVQDVKRSNVLTTGYHSGQLDENFQVINKPFGKCSHGGFLDDSSLMSGTGGINKDSPFEVWSPHHYLYEQAVRVAQQATINFLAEIRIEVNNDILFSTFLGVPHVGNSSLTISIAYVIDNTGSMSTALPQIQASLSTIRANLMARVSSFGGGVQVRYILVPFNDQGIASCYYTAR